MGAYDVERIKPPTHLILHHSVSPEGDDIRKWSDSQVANWFSETGRTRTYTGYLHSFHYDPRTGQETFAAVQIALWPNGDDSDLNKDTWRVIPLTQSWYDDICWHAGNWIINTKSVGCETYGRYDNKTLPGNAVWALAKWCRENIDARNNKSTIIMGHKQIYQTACPGDWMNHIDQLIDMINNPDKYKGQYFTFEEKQQMIEQLQNQINQLSSQINQLNNQVSQQNGQISQLQGTVSNLTNDINGKNNQINQLNDQINQQNSLIADLRNQLANSGSNQDLLQSIENYKNQISVEINRRKNLENQLLDVQDQLQACKEGR
jgi:chaperonin cofactor prefoldin